MVEYLEYRGVGAEVHVDGTGIVVRGRLGTPDVDFITAVTRRRVILGR